jgi:hypothetical protein
LLLVVLAHPNGDGVAPETVSRETPVLGILEPVVKTTLLGKRRHPVTLLVVKDQLILEIGDLDKPAMHGLIDERSL